MSTGWKLFGFETDFSGTLHCIPMVVRFKLDQCGIKLSLKQWNRFPLENREQLVTGSCATREDIESYRRLLVGLIETRANGQAVSVEVETHAEWTDTARVPARLHEYARKSGVEAPSIQKWGSLTSLQRFALFKLTRPGHDNDNFIPAMREFGLTG